MDFSLVFSMMVLFFTTAAAATLLILIEGDQRENQQSDTQPNFWPYCAKGASVSLFLGTLAALAGTSWRVGQAVFVLSSFLFLIGLGRRSLREKNRRKETDRDLPLLLDFLVLQVEAGNSISQALKSASDLFPGTSPVSQGLSRFQQNTRLGSPLEPSLEDLACFLDTYHAQTAINSLSQAIRHGTPLGTILRDLSNRMRTHLIMEGEKFANTLSIKLLIPLIMFIFPASFLVIFCPVIVSLKRMLR